MQKGLSVSMFPGTSLRRVLPLPQGCLTCSAESLRARPVFPVCPALAACQGGDTLGAQWGATLGVAWVHPLRWPSVSLHPSLPCPAHSPDSRILNQGTHCNGATFCYVYEAMVKIIAMLVC